MVKEFLEVILWVFLWLLNNIMLPRCTRLFTWNLINNEYNNTEKPNDVVLLAIVNINDGSGYFTQRAQTDFKSENLVSFVKKKKVGRAYGSESCSAPHWRSQHSEIVITRFSTEEKLGEKNLWPLLMWRSEQMI